MKGLVQTKQDNKTFSKTLFKTVKSNDEIMDFNLLDQKKWKIAEETDKLKTGFRDKLTQESMVFN